MGASNDLLRYLSRVAAAVGAARQPQAGQGSQPAGMPGETMPGETAGLNFGADPQTQAQVPPPQQPAPSPLAATPTGEAASDAQPQPRHDGAGLSFGPPPVQGFTPNPAAATPPAAPMPAQPAAGVAASPSGLDFGQLPPGMREAAEQIQALRSAPPPEDTPGQSRWGTFGGVLKHTLPATLERMGDSAERDPAHYGAADFFGQLVGGAIAPAGVAALGNSHMRATDERLGREAQIDKLRLNFGKQAQEQGAMADVREKNASATYHEAEAYKAAHPAAPAKHYAVEKTANGYFAVNAADPTDRFPMPDMGGAEQDYDIREVSDGHGGKRLVGINKRKPTDQIDLNLSTSDAKGHPIKASDIPRSFFGLKNENEMTDEARSAVSKISNKTRAQNVNPALLVEGSPYRNDDGTPNMDLIWANVATGKLHVNEAFPTVTDTERNDVEQAVAQGRARIRSSQTQRATLVDRYASIVERVSQNPPEGADTQEVTLDALHTKMRDILDRLDSKNVKERAQAQKDIETFFQALQHVRIR